MIFLFKKIGGNRFLASCLTTGFIVLTNITKMAANGLVSPKPIRLTSVTGYEDRINDIVYGRPVNSKSTDVQVVVFFPGDVQDYIENMESHRDNKMHKHWNLEETAAKLQSKFPDSHILVVKPSRMDFKTFSCFQNFVNSDQLGVPNHTPDYSSLRHLDCLIAQISERLKDANDSTRETAVPNLNLNNLNLKIIGFSKGCVVLNQFVHEFHHFKTAETDEQVTNVINRIKDMYWLDGGHSGGKNTWITDKEILKTFSTLGINIHVHVTPYQIACERRPWIKKEEKAFSDYLTKESCNIERMVHFENDVSNIDTHFEIINVFKK